METLAELCKYIADDKGLSALREVAEKASTSDQSHDIGHALRVALWTIRLGATEIDTREAVAAALCHDLVNPPKNSPERRRASTLSAEAARALLPAHGFCPGSVESIADAIRDHSFSRGVTPRSLLGRALRDADRLEALGSIGIMRTVSTGSVMGAKYFDPHDPFGSSRELDDLAFTVDHFFTKLLRLQNEMCTQPGRLEAVRRTRLMELFLKELAEELGAPRPDFTPSSTRRQ